MISDTRMLTAADARMAEIQLLLHCECVDWLTSQGVRFAPGGIRKGAAGFDITFLHPKANEEFPIGGEGVLIELVQAPDEVVKAFAALAANAH